MASSQSHVRFRSGLFGNRAFRHSVCASRDPRHGAGSRGCVSLQQGVPSAAAGFPAAGGPQFAKTFMCKSEAEGRFEALQSPCRDLGPRRKYMHMQYLDRFQKKARMDPVQIPSHPSSYAGGGCFAACPCPAVADSGAERPGRAVVVQRRQRPAGWLRRRPRAAGHNPLWCPLSQQVFDRSLSLSRPDRLAWASAHSVRRMFSGRPDCCTCPLPSGGRWNLWTAPR